MSACSDLGAGGLDGPTETATAAPGQGDGELTISNWPAYIDRNTVAEFEEKTGISVEYIEDVNDNNEFFSKLQPTLANSDPAGRSIVVVTDWMANKMHDLGYLQNFDQKSVAPAMENLIPSLAVPVLRPEPRVLAALAERHDRPRRQHGRGARRQEHQRPLRPRSTTARSRS